MLSCLTWQSGERRPSERGRVLDVKMLLALRDALRANEPAPFDAACWMADAIDQIVQQGGSLDKRLGLRQRGKPSVRRTAEIAKRDALLRALATHLPEKHINKQADLLIAMIEGQTIPSDSDAAATLEKLRTFKHLPRSSRQVARILSVQK